MPRPLLNDHPEFYQTYVALVKETDLAEAFKNQGQVIGGFLNSIPKEKADFAYAEGKWTLKELLQHMIDTERIFNYRSVCISRKEKTSLPGFDENEYVINSNAGNRNWDDLVEEFLVVRRSTEILFNSFTDDMLQNTGTANGSSIKLNSIGYITIGHVYHHKKIIEDRYLTSV